MPMRVPGAGKMSNRTKEERFSSASAHRRPHEKRLKKAENVFAEITVMKLQQCTVKNRNEAKLADWLPANCSDTERSQAQPLRNQKPERDPASVRPGLVGVPLCDHHLTGCHLLASAEGPGEVTGKFCGLSRSQADQASLEPRKRGEQ